MKRTLAALAALIATVALTVNPTTAEADYVDYTFASIPDLFNNDFADVSDAVGWDPGDPNSINPAYTAAIQRVLSDLKAQGPQAVLMAGDAVEGHWGMDNGATGIFGPAKTNAERTQHANRAGSQYYGSYVRRFADRGMPLYAAVGDHELGDNPWNSTDTSTYKGWKRANVDEFKAKWAQWFTDGGARFASRPVGTDFEDTAYATYLHPEVLLITVDQFKRTSTDVVFDVSWSQIEWMRTVLADANARGVDWVMVQGHNPVLGPVRVRFSSGAMLEGGESSLFWQTMKQYGVDLYLAGEVHDNTTTVSPNGGPVQITHGGLLRLGHAAFVTGRIVGETMTLETRTWNTRIVSQPAGQQVWQTDKDKTITHDVVYEPGTFAIGSMQLTKDGAVLNRDGVMSPQ